MADISPEQALGVLKEKCKTIVLSTLSEDGQPYCSYTPFCLDGNSLLVFISELAEHTRNIFSNPTLSAMLIEDEADTKQIFARTRLTLTCEAKAIARDSSEYAKLLEQFQSRHGKTVELLRELPDFHLMRLTPTSGRIVLGFGQAYQLAGDQLDQFVHTRGA